MDYEEIIFERSNQIATITLNRPNKLNPMTDRMMGELGDAIRKVEDDPNLRVTVTVTLIKRMLYQFLTETDIDKAESISHQYLERISTKGDTR